MDWGNVTLEELLSSLQEVASEVQRLVIQQTYVWQAINCIQYLACKVFRLAKMPVCTLQVEWSQPPQLPREFFGKFSLPSTQRKLETRLKCNTYYYRANYLLILVAALLVAFLRSPWALLATLAAMLGSLCLNNTFSVSLRYGQGPDIGSWRACCQSLR